MVKMPGISLPKFSLPGLGRKKAGDAPGAADAISGRIGDAPKKKLAGKHIVGIGLVGLVVLGGGAYGLSALFSGPEPEMAEGDKQDAAAGDHGMPSEPVETIATEMPDGTIHFGPRAELRLPPKRRPGDAPVAPPPEPEPEKMTGEQAPQLLAPPPEMGSAESGDHAIASPKPEAGQGSGDQATTEHAAAEPVAEKPEPETFVAPEAKSTGDEPPVPKAAPKPAVTVASILPANQVYPETPPRFEDLNAFTTDPDPLAPVDPALTEKAPQGDLPRIASDGREVWKHYARPATADTGRPKVAIVIVQLGMNKLATETAIRNLPPEVTLAFSSTERNLSRWVTQAREIGHEVLIDLPMEPENFPLNDPGPNTLLTTVPDKENLERLEATLSAATGYIGVATLTGGRFTANREKLLPVVAALKERGLMMIDGSVEAGRAVPTMAVQAGAPVARADVILDSVPSRKAIDAQLARLEQIVRNNGVAVAVGHAYPSTFERLHNWIALARKAGIDVVPLSALANKQKIL
tara:strand:+ start:3970 stop:5535 length:1566 start_codon:yes stop_codon:yes gene_type:complete